MRSISIYDGNAIQWNKGRVGGRWNRIARSIAGRNTGTVRPLCKYGPIFNFHRSNAETRSEKLSEKKKNRKRKNGKADTSGNSEVERHSPPLIVGVDVPDDALGEDLVLVHGDEGTQGEGGDLLDHDGVGRAVALEDLEKTEGFRSHPGGII